MNLDGTKPTLSTSASSSAPVIAAVTTVMVVVMFVVIVAILVLLTVCLLRGRKVCFLHNSLINIHILPLQNKKRHLNKAESDIPGSNGPVTTTTSINDRRSSEEAGEGSALSSSDDMEEAEEGLHMTREDSGVGLSSPTPLVSEESKYARVEAVRGPRPPPRLGQRVEYEEIDLKATKVS